MVEDNTANFGAPDLLSPEEPALRRPTYGRSSFVRASSVIGSLSKITTVTERFKLQIR